MKYVALIFFCNIFLSSALNIDLENGTIQPYNGSNLFSKPSIECRDYHKLHNSSEWCKFINETENCQMDEGFVDYISTAFCKFNNKYLPAIATIYAIWLIFLFVGLGTSAEGFFCPALEYIAHNLGLSENIAGLTIVAFGNGAPDLFSAFAAFTNPNPSATSVAVGALLGAAMLLTTVVAGLVATTQEFTIPQRPFLRDMSFFIASTFWAFYCLYYSEIPLLSSVGFLVFYVFYVTVVAIGRYINQRQRAARKASIQEEVKEGGVNEVPEVNENTALLSATRNTNNNHAEQELSWEDVKLRTSSWNSEKRIQFSVPDGDQSKTDIPSSSGDIPGLDDIIEEKVNFDGESIWFILWFGLKPFRGGEWKRAGAARKIVMILQVPWKVLCNATIPLVGYEEHNDRWNRPLYCLSLLLSPMLCVFATKGGDVTIGGVFPVWALLLLIGAIFSVAVWFTSTNEKKPVYQWVFAYIGFVVAIILTYTIANEIVNLIQTFGTMLNITNVIMGLTFLAWGNSIGDVIADVSLARRGNPRMSISACFGGPLFNLLIGLGLPCTVAIIQNGGSPVQVAFTHIEATICGGLLTSLCISFLVIPLRGFRITPTYGYLLIALYLVFLILAILAGVGVI